MIDKLSVEPITDYRCLHAEGPLWNPKDKAIAWVDIIDGKIHEINTLTGEHTIINVGHSVGAVAFTTNNNFIAALQNGFAFVDRKTHKVKWISDPETDKPGNRFNDGKTAPDGRFWAGTMALDETSGVGSVYVLNSELIYKKVIENTTISNGMAWDEQKKKFYFIDSVTSLIVVYDYNEIGEIFNKQIAIRIPVQEGFPDGMTIDSEGMIWVAMWGGWQVVRWNPTTGEKLLSIRLPAAHVSSCTFGGEGLNDIYITTSQQGLSEKEIEDQSDAGKIFVVKNCGYKGLETYLFPEV